MTAAPTGRSKTVLVVGSGGREHALAWKLAQSPSVARLIVAPGNDGMFASVTAPFRFERWPLASGEGKAAFEPLARKAKAEGVDLVVVGPDNPLADGIVDVLQAAGVTAFGPSAAAARLEASKAFAKDVMRAAGVPTAGFEVARSAEQAHSVLDAFPAESWPESGGAGWVVKADGLALGKGVIVTTSRKHAHEAVDQLIGVSGELVIEERLTGKEVSWMALCDGERCALLEPARDHKRLLDADAGPNTGGMGAFSPVPELQSEAVYRRVRSEVFMPVMAEMKRRGAPFSGVLYAGLMVDEARDRMWVLEFNARFGDPEAQILLPRIAGDVYPWFEAAARGSLDGFPWRVPFRPESAVCVVGAAPGYPESPKKGISMHGPLAEQTLDRLEPEYFFAGVAAVGGASPGENGAGYVTSGGRVLASLGMGPDLASATAQAYARVSRVGFEGMHYRTDIAGGVRR